MTPAPWSHSALECFTNCPEQYHHKYVLKDLPPEQKTAEQDWGTYVHKQFEYYLKRYAAGFELPHDLQIHLPYLEKLARLEDAAVGNRLMAEQKVALGRQPFGPCEYFDKRVWWRGIIDATIVEPVEARARVVDFKTGKEHDKWEQLAMSAVYTFLAYPAVNLVMAEFYWTATQRATKKVWGRQELDSLVGMLAPKLQDYAIAFKTDTWPKKQSGLCRGYCPVTTCSFWEERRSRR